MTTRREELLDLASELLERDGLEQFGIGTFARAAGVKPPSLYKHFAGIDDIEHALISRGFREFGASMADAAATVEENDGVARLAAFASTYRRTALERPQHYRLMTGRHLDRHLLEPGAELAGMAALLDLFGEDETRFDISRAAWAWAHGLVSLEIADRYPPGVDLDASWAVLVDALSARLPG